MRLSPIYTAARTRDIKALCQRLHAISKRYGLTATPMERSLHQFSELLEQFDCPATVPVTAISLSRYRQVINRYLSTNIEFAVHGYTHTDYSLMKDGAIAWHLRTARKNFTKAGLSPAGFRSPYLSRPGELHSALASAGFSYVSNQPFLWENVDPDTCLPSPAGYTRALCSYDPWKSGQRLSLPRLVDGLVEIPVSLPDDEMLVDRKGCTPELVRRVWLNMLAQSYRHGELLTLQLHPERIALCTDPLAALLAEARRRSPAVWCAQLNEVAAWWRARSQARFEISYQGDDHYQCLVNGPQGLTVLARGVSTEAPTSAWMNGYSVVHARCFNFHSPLRPLVGVAPSSPPGLISHLRQLGFAVEPTPDKELYGCHIEQPDFAGTDERRIMEIIRKSDRPVVRLGYWPNAYASALCITGDIDAFTLWDFALRILGK